LISSSLFPPLCYDGPNYETFAARLVDFIENQISGSKIVSEKNDSPRYLRVLVQDLEKNRFVDELEFYFTPNDNTIQFRLAHLIGTDFSGINRKRIEAIVKALGLDYAMSGYPESHICDSNSSLPASGVDSVQYPEVVFELRGLNAADGTPLTRIDAGSEVSVLALGSWTIHGVRKDQIVSLKATRTNEGGSNRLRVRGDFNLMLKDFGIEVMAWAGLIKVADRAKVKLDLDLSEARQ
jgi:uncharacterized protein (DUF1499 family)